MEVTLELSDLVVMQSKHTISHIIHLNKLATGLPVAKILIKYNINNSEDNQEEKNPIDIEFSDQKSDPENDENTIIDFRRSGIQKEY